MFDQGADIVVLPEMTTPWYSTDREALAPLAETLDGPTVTAWQSLADRPRRSCGGRILRAGERSIFNTAVAVSGDGVIAHYRKLHLFDVEKHCFEPATWG